MGTSELSGKPDEMLGSNLRSSQVTPRYFVGLDATETGISSGCVGHLARVQTLPLAWSAQTEH